MSLLKEFILALQRSQRSRAAIGFETDFFCIPVLISKKKKVMEKLERQTKERELQTALL